MNAPTWLPSGSGEQYHQPSSTASMRVRRSPVYLCAGKCCKADKPVIHKPGTYKMPDW